MKTRQLPAILLVSAMLSACNQNTDGNTLEAQGKARDTTPPTVSLSITPSSLTAAGNVSMAATASDNVGVKQVNFYDGTTLLGTDTTAPYSFSKTYTSAQNGSRTIKAVALDAAGNQASSTQTLTVNISTVSDTTAPTVSLSASDVYIQPGESTTTLTATASDNIGVAKIQFYDGLTLIGTDTQAPFELTRTFTCNDSGTKEFKAFATDAAGNRSSQATRWVDIALPCTTVPLSQRHSYVNEDGVLVLDGKPTFMHAIGSVSWNRPYQQQLQDLDRIASLGFNIVGMSPYYEQSTGDGTWPALLDRAQTLGMQVMSESYKPSKDDMVREIGNHPAFLGWYVLDDAQNKPVAELERETAISRALDSGRVEMSSLGIGSTDLSAYFSPRTPQMMSNQSYPIGNDNIYVVYSSMRELVQYAEASSAQNPTDGIGTMPIAHLQSFTWGLDKPRPTPDQMRNMNDQALAAGVKGVMYYTYFDTLVAEGPQNPNDMATYFGYDQELTRLNAEMTQLGPSLISQKPTILPTEEWYSDANGYRWKEPSDYVKASVWNTPMGRVMVVVNRDDHATTHIGQVNPGNVTNLRPMFPNRPNMPQIQKEADGSLTISMGPIQSGWFLLD